MNETKEIKKDEALIRLMQPNADTRLPFMFNEQLMKRIEAEAKRKARINTFWQYASVSVISIALIIGTIKLLFLYTSFNLIHKLEYIFNSAFISPDLKIYTFIGGCILILLYLDHTMRRRYEARHTKDSGS